MQHLRQAAVRGILADVFRNILKSYYTSHPEQEVRRESSRYPCTAFFPCGSLCPAGRWSWIQGVEGDEWAAKPAWKSRRKNSSSNPLISQVRPASPATGTWLRVCLLSPRLNLYFQDLQSQSGAGSQPSATGRPSQKGGENSEGVAVPKL